jgi:two-component system, LytTR family, sensor kinase
MKRSFFDNRISKTMLHLLGWCCFLFYPYIIGVPLREDIFLKYLLHTILLAGFFYANGYILIPKLLTKGKISLYFTAILLIMASIVAINFSFHHFLDIDYRSLAENGNFSKHISGNRDLKRLMRAFFSFLFIFAVSTSYKLLMDWFKAEREKKEIENENLSSELSFLKSQVSPHFLFNTLNNIYSLSLSNSNLTSDAILKLSQLLRYMLYESDVKQVGLDKEVEYLNNYIELQKMRTRSGDITISFITSGNLSENVIEPMLLIPFIENAFKHGINYSMRSKIFISLSLLENVLHLKVKNDINSTKEKDKAKGIGLNNVKRRLDLLYPGNHKLVIKEEQDKFMVQLEIVLKK